MLVRNGTNTNGVTFYIDGVRDTRSNTLNSTYNFTDSRTLIGSAYDNPNLYNLQGYIDEFRVSKTCLYTGSSIPVPTAPFPDPSNYTVSKIAAGKAGQYGSGGGGGGSTYGVLQDLNRGYMGGKGGDGYVLVISW